MSNLFSSAFCVFVTELVAHVSDGVVPKVNALQRRVADQENKRIWNDATEGFKRAMRDEKNNTLYESMSAKFNALQRQAIETFDRNLVPVSQGYLPEVIQTFKVD